MLPEENVCKVTRGSTLVDSQEILIQVCWTVWVAWFNLAVWGTAPLIKL